MSRLGESNPGPTHYECVALPSELRRRVHRVGWLDTIAHYIQQHDFVAKPKQVGSISTEFHLAVSDHGPDNHRPTP